MTEQPYQWKCAECGSDRLKVIGDCLCGSNRFIQNTMPIIEQQGDKLLVKTRMYMTKPDKLLVTDAMIEEVCFAWLQTLFPARVDDDTIRARITDLDRRHVGVILKAALPTMEAARTPAIDVAALVDDLPSYEEAKAMMPVAIREVERKPFQIEEVAIDDEGLVERALRAIVDESNKKPTGEGLVFSYGEVERGIRAALKAIRGE